MPTLVIRLAGPVQSWAGYVASYRKTTTYPVPSKSGVAGLLGACLGETNYTSLVPLFNLWIRADRTNAFETDLQVASFTKPNEVEGIRRSAAVAGFGVLKGTALNPTGSSPRKADRDFLSHSEFICGLEVDDSHAAEWAKAIRKPMFVTYLGRRGNAPTFPFFLGVSQLGAVEILGAIPRARQHDETPGPGTVRIHEALGDYNTHDTRVQTVSPPVTTRKEQLTWSKQNLAR